MNNKLSSKPGEPKDSLFAKPLGSVADFKFDQSVVDVFPDMLQRSIPGYESIIAQSGLLAARYAVPDTRLYDLGSSLGATSLSMQASLHEREQSGLTVGDCEIHAVDNSGFMLERCRSIIELANNPGPVIHLHQSDIQDVPLSSASVVALNFTLQFIPFEDRETLMHRIANALVPGGALILSEKLRFSDPVVNELHIDMYHAFKRANGYSDLEISQKRTALENVLVPDTLEIHHKRLANAGFSNSSVWFQCFNFASIIAIR